VLPSAHAWHGPTRKTVSTMCTSTLQRTTISMRFQSLVHALMQALQKGIKMVWIECPDVIMAGQACFHCMHVCADVLKASESRTHELQMALLACLACASNEKGTSCVQGMRCQPKGRTAWSLVCSFCSFRHHWTLQQPTQWLPQLHPPTKTGNLITQVPQL
jgi:hypothetical protein